MAKQVRIRKGLYAVQQHQKPSQLLPNNAVDVEQLSGTLRARLAVSVPYDAVVGSSIQVTNGEATHPTIASAISAVPTGATILLLAGTFTSPGTISKEVYIHGRGRTTVISGAVTFGTGSGGTMCKFLKFSGDVTIQNGVRNLILTDCWLGTGLTLTDSNPSPDYNLLLIKQED